VKSNFAGMQLAFNKERYRVYGISLNLIDAANFDWDRNWDQAWRKYMKGSRLAAKKWRWYMLYGARLIGGYPVGYTHIQQAANEPVTGVTLQVVITDDLPLPTMHYYNADGFEAGNGFYRWKGNVYKEDSVVDPELIAEYGAEAKPDNGMPAQGWELEAEGADDSGEAGGLA